MSQPSDAQSQRPQPVPTAETLPFWEGAREGTLILNRCRRCDAISVPLAPRCSECLSPELSSCVCSGRASLRGRTVLHLEGLPGREPPIVIVECTVEEAPHVMLVALDEDNVTSCLRPNAALRLGFRPDDNGWSYLVVEGSVT